MQRNVSRDSVERVPKKRKKQENTRNAKRTKLPVGNNAHPAQGGIYLKGVRSQFTERYVLNDENSARRDEDLCRLIDCGLPQLRKPEMLNDENDENQQNANLQFGLFESPQKSDRHETVVRGEETDRGFNFSSPSFLHRSPGAISPGFRLPSQHHFQHSAPRGREATRRDKSTRDLAYLLPSPEQPSDTYGQLPSIRPPSDLFNKKSAPTEGEKIFEFDQFESSSQSSQHKRQRFTPFDHSTPIISSTSVGSTQQELTIEDGYLDFQEQLDRVLHDVTSFNLLEDDLSDRQQLCEYYTRRLRLIENDSPQKF